MTEQDQAQSSLGTDGVSAAPASEPELQARLGKRCAQCGRPFGLVRRHRAGKQFCSERCLEEYSNARRDGAEGTTRWFEFLHRRR